MGQTLLSHPKVENTTLKYSSQKLSCQLLAENVFAPPFPVFPAPVVTGRFCYGIMKDKRFLPILGK
jgi:hypothetical protein